MANYSFDNNTPFTEAVDFFRQKTRIATRSWLDLQGDMHARGFMVAGAMRDSLLADLQSSIQTALEKGTTIADFRKDFDKTIAKHGWQYKGKRGWRTNVIFNTNIAQSYQAGHWAQIIEDKETRPFLVYKTQDDGLVRDEHSKWHNVVLPVDDAWWHTHYPLNGFNCRCYTRQLTAQDIADEGLKIRDAAPPLNNKKVRVRGGGDNIEVTTPDGVGAGFAGNAGRAWLSGVDDNLPHHTGKAIPLKGFVKDNAIFNLTPKNLPLKKARLALSEKDMNGLINNIINNKENIMQDALGNNVRIGKKLASYLWRKKTGAVKSEREKYLPFLPELLQKPHEIRVQFMQYPNGKVFLRKSYILSILDGDAQKNLFLLADEQQGLQSLEIYDYEAFNLYNSNANNYRKVQLGLPIAQ